MAADVGTQVRLNDIEQYVYYNLYAERLVEWKKYLYGQEYDKNMNQDTMAHWLLEFRAIYRHLYPRVMPDDPVLCQANVEQLVRMYKNHFKRKRQHKYLKHK